MDVGPDELSTCAGNMCPGSSQSTEGMIKEKDFLKRVAPGRWPQKDKKETSQDSRQDSPW